MRRKPGKLNARLFLDGHDVGTIEVKGWDDAWGFGDFTPGPGFASYARPFGDWSRLMHARYRDAPVSRGDREALRRVEYEIDRLRAGLLLVETRQWRPIGQLNIDGPLVEWHEDSSGEVAPRAA